MKEADTKETAPVNPWLIAAGHAKTPAVRIESSYKSRGSLLGEEKESRVVCRLSQNQRDKIFQYIADHCKGQAMYAKTMYMQMLNTGLLKNKKGGHMSLSSFQKIFTIFRESGRIENKRKLIIKCVRQNLSTAKIAQIVGASEGYIRHVKSDAGLRIETKSEHIKRLLARNKTVHQIAKATGASDKYIYYLRKKCRDQAET